MKNNLWGWAAGLAVLLLVASCGPEVTRSEPEPPTVTLTVTALNWDALNNTSAQTYFSVDVRVTVYPPLRDGHTLDPKRFTYALSGGSTAYSSYPYLVGESSCSPGVLFLASTCRVHFLFREGLSRAELVPATITYASGLTGSGEVLELP